MDTDDLSIEAYEGILVEAEKLAHDLTLHFAVLVSKCSNEDDYLDMALEFIAEIRKYDEDDLIELFFNNVPDGQLIDVTLRRMEQNIHQVKKIPKEQRTYDF